MIERQSLRVYQLSILVLAVEWILFGSAHFTFRAETVLQIPEVLPFKTFIAITTGMLEVVTGILLLFRRTRKWAAIASLVMLCTYLWPIYRMLAYDYVIPGSAAFRNSTRVLLVPNHVFMALCALYLARWPDRPAEARSVGGFAASRSAASRTVAVFTGGAPLVVALVMLAANVAGFAVLIASSVQDMTLAFWALMCLSVGGLVGFLFGVPRVTFDGAARVTHRPNSNIEALSDWLTKIIVGVGLLEFHSVGTFLDRVSSDVGRAVPGADAARGSAFAKALIVYFFVAGVIQGYLLTRMYLAERFEELELPPPAPAAAAPEVVEA